MEDCVDGKLNYKHEGIHEDLVELYCLMGEEVDKTDLVEVEQVTHFEKDQLVNRKKALGGVHRNIAKRLKLFKDPLMLKLNNAHPKLFPPRLKFKWFKHSTIKQVQRKVHLKVDSNKATRIKPPPTVKPPILKLDYSRLNEFPGKLEYFLFAGTS